jgi:hypothetical protein
MMQLLRKFEDKMLRIDSNKIFIAVCILVVIVLMTICVGMAIIVTKLATS